MLTNAPRIRSQELCTLKTDFAVLDAQWSPYRAKGQEALAVATSGPVVEVYRLDSSADGRSAELTSSTWLLVEDSQDEDTGDVLALSLAWHPTNSKLMAVTLSSGEVQYCESAGDFAELGHHYSTSTPAPLKHELEAWTAAFSPTSAGLFSGGDDCALRYLKPNETGDGIEASWQDKRLHEAGVTAILPLSDDMIVTGSYDDHVRLIYAPTVGRRQVLADLNLDGGVWRLKMVDTSGHLGTDDPAGRYVCTHSLHQERTSIFPLCYSAPSRLDVCI